MSDWQKYLKSAAGFLEIGLLDDASLELENIPPELRSHSDVFGLRVSIYMAAKKWEEAATVAEHLTKREPDISQHWISYAYATRRAESIPKAEAILLNALKSHPQEPMVHYNLACYAAQTGRTKEAKERLKSAISLDESYRAIAFDDLDLKSL